MSPTFNELRNSFEGNGSGWIESVKYFAFFRADFSTSSAKRIIWQKREGKLTEN